MNKYILSLIVLCFSTSMFSQEDTTFVQAHDYVDLDWNGNYDSWAVFPDGTESYRKILMHYDMRCSSSGCSGWDYTTKIIILKDTAEEDENGNTENELLPDLTQSKGLINGTNCHTSSKSGVGYTHKVLFAKS